jgi:hypothetical protein
MKNKLILTTTLAMLVLTSFVVADWHQADFNNDGAVNLGDAGFFSSCIGWVNGSNQTECAQADFNFDGVVNLQDSGIFMGYLGCNNGSDPNSSCWD